MELLHALLGNIIGKDQCGGTTVSVNISMLTPKRCCRISRYSTAGGDETSIVFKPDLPLEEALIQAAKYTEKGHFEHN